MNTSETVKSEHTPTPWTCINSHKAGFDNVVSFGNDERESRKYICEVQRTDTQDAAFIVTACNAHDVLLDACKAILEKYLSGELCLEDFDQVKAAISLATNT